MRALAAVLLSALLYALAQPPFGWAWLSWFCLVPLFLVVARRSPLAAGCFAALWSFLATVMIVAWLVPTLHEHFEKSLAVSLGFLLLVGAVTASPFYGVAFAAAARSRRVLPGWLEPWLWVAAWVSAEYARSQLAFRSPWALLGESQFASLRLRQIADLGGVYAVSALLVLGNLALGALALALAGRVGRDVATRRRISVLVGCFGVLLIAALSYGELRARTLDDRGGHFEVALVQGNVPPDLRWRRAGASRVLRRYVRLTLTHIAQSAERPPDLVVWPENAIQTELLDPVYGPPVRKLAGRGVPLLIGLPRSELREGVRRHFNSVALMVGDEPPRYYDKRILLPFSETSPTQGLLKLSTARELEAAHYTPGEGPGIFRLGGEKLAVLVCMEALYPALAREAAVGGASILLNVSNDSWYRGWGGAEQHLAQVVFRAVETRVPLVRATSNGITAIVAPDGGLVARLESGVASVLRAAVPPAGPRPTLYTRVGDSFAFGCLLLCGLGLLVEGVGRLWKSHRAG